MESKTYHVQADWDAEAGVWVATSDDVPGLATEAETIERLTDRLRTIIPELLVANGLLPRNDHDQAITF
jgi:predicted RNase H-like HicB family nuclease